MKIKILFCLSALIFLLTSCEVTETTAFRPQITLNCYTFADSSLDSVYISRNAKVNELIIFENLKLSSADTKLYEDGTLIGQLVEYSARKGVYHLPDSLNFVFKIGKKYKLTADYPSYQGIYAETVCPDTLHDLSAVIMPSSQPMNFNGKIDTIEYKPGKNFIDNIYFESYYDNTVMSGKRLGIYQVAPEHREQSYWLEDTTKVVWDEYENSVQFFKDKEQFGKDFYYWFDATLYINWLAFYSKGMNYIRFGSLDEVRYNYLVDMNNQEEGHVGNVTNGNGLFTISSYNKKVYKVFVKDDEPNNLLK